MRFELYEVPCVVYLTYPLANAQPIIISTLDPLSNQHASLAQPSYLRGLILPNLLLYARRGAPVNYRL
jgi:hypothetical protein